MARVERGGQTSPPVALVTGPDATLQQTPNTHVEIVTLAVAAQVGLAEGGTIIITPQIVIPGSMLEKIDGITLARNNPQMAAQMLMERLGLGATPVEVRLAIKREAIQHNVLADLSRAIDAEAVNAGPAVVGANVVPFPDLLGHRQS